MFGTGPPPPLSKRIFKKYDTDGSGNISTSEFQKLCYEMGYFLSSGEVNIAVKLIDTSGEGEIGYDEFLKWWRTDKRFGKLQLSEEKLEKLSQIITHFQYFDKDSSGTISKEEWNGLHENLKGAGYWMLDDDASKAFDSLDTDGEGSISFNEYVQFMIRSGVLGA